MKKELLNRKESGLQDLENPHPVQIAKSEETYSKENTKCVADWTIWQSSVVISYRPLQPSKQSGIEMGLYQEKIASGDKRKQKIGWNEGKLWMWIILQEKGRKTLKTIQRPAGLLLPPQAQTVQPGKQDCLYLVSKGKALPCRAAWEGLHRKLSGWSQVGGTLPSWRGEATSGSRGMIPPSQWF